MHYDPTLTFEANGDRLDATKGPGRAQDIANALREAYEDGWHDARARHLPGPLRETWLRAMLDEV